MTARVDYDTPWKKILDNHLKDFLSLCYPKAAKKIDWSRKYELLDKELSKITEGVETGNLFVDKLIKVWLKDGKEAWVLIHIEVQGEAEKNFEQRMFTYHYRIFDKYKKPILSMAILTDRSRRWRPSYYKHSLWDCRLGFNFVTLKLLDFERQRKHLANSANPFAIVILAHLSALKTKPDQERLLNKSLLIRTLFRKGWDRTSILNIFDFIGGIIALPPNLEAQLLDELKVFEKENKMNYTTYIEQIYLERGLEQGREQGIEKGEKSVLIHLLQSKFGVLPPKYKQRLEQAKEPELMKLAENILKVTTLEEVFNSINECVE
jgi:hypothetical protein